MKAPKKIDGKPGKGLFGKKRVGLSRAEGIKNLVYGTGANRDDTWPLGMTETDPLAKAAVEATDRGTR